MQDRIKELIDKLGVKKIAIVGAIIVIAIAGTVVGVSTLKPANEVVEEDKNKDKDTDKEKAEEKNEDTETKEDVAQETVVEEETTEEQTETTEGTVSTTTGNTNSTTTTTPSNNTSGNNSNNSSSANQNTQTQTPTNPTTPTTPTANTWFNKKGFTITPVSSTFCASNVAGHKCGSNLKIESTTEYADAGKKWIEIAYSSSCECFDNYRLSMFDKYTGTCLQLYKEEYTTFVCNGQEVQFRGALNAGGGWYNAVVECSLDYDGVVFVFYPVTRDKNANLTELCSIEDVIDLSGNDCYFFSYGYK